MDGKDRKFKKYFTEILYGLQTLIDVPFLLISVLVFLIAPWRTYSFFGKFKSTEANKWRFMIIKEIINGVIDFPFFMMFIVICCSIFMALKL